MRLRGTVRFRFAGFTADLDSARPQFLSQSAHLIALPRVHKRPLELAQYPRLAAVPALRNRAKMRSSGLPRRRAQLFSAAAANTAVRCTRARLGEVPA